MLILVWADHANLISTAYSGTGALKTDYTRTGKRGKMGLLEDGMNSVMRYLKNNYFDGPRQVSWVKKAFVMGGAKKRGRGLLADLRFDLCVLCLKLQIGRVRPVYRFLDASAGYVVGDDIACR